LLNPGLVTNTVSKKKSTNPKEQRIKHMLEYLLNKDLNLKQVQRRDSWRDTGEIFYII